MKKLHQLLSIPALAALPARAATEPGKPQSLTSPDQVPEGLAKSDWSSIRAAYEAGRHAFQPTASGWQARNPGQQWTTQFDKRGFLASPKDGGWQWGLELQSYGFAENPTAIAGTPAVQADGQRLSYQWDANVQEWFVNDTRGLEHGFTVNQRPASAAASATLDFLLGVRGGLRPQITGDALGVEFLDAAGATVLNYSGLKVWDADGKVLASRFAAAGENQVRLLVDERGARYPLTIDPVAQQAYLKASNNGGPSDDQFGTSVAVSGDTVVVGANLEDSSSTGVNGTPDDGAANAGAAYVFVRNGGAWTQQAYLKASNTGVDDRFGFSVAVAGDTLVVGANRESSSTTGVNSTPNQLGGETGAAYVFTRSGTTWTQQAYLKASQVTTFDQFGDSVAVSGDTIVVGASGEDSSTTGVNSTPNEFASSSGAAYVFTRSGTTWTQQAYLKSSQVSGSDNFGNSVAVSGETVVVGAKFEDSSTAGVDSTANETATDSGAAYVFVRSGTTWTQQTYLKASQVTASDQFGHSVAVSGNTLVVGAYQEDSSTTGVNSTPNESGGNSGAAYVFSRSGTTWTQQAYLKASQVSLADAFGFSVAVSGDTVVVGAPREDSSTTSVNSSANEGAVDSGAAYVFVRSGTTWTQQAYLKASNTGAGDNFGHSVAVAGDTLVVGAPYEDSSTTGVNSTPNETASVAGAANLFVRSGTTWTQQAYLKASNTPSSGSGAGDNFGTSVSVSDDTVVVGAPFEDSGTRGVNSTPNEGSSDSGAAYVFVRSGTTWTQQAYLKDSVNSFAGFFGTSVAISGDTVVVGTPREYSSTTGVNTQPNFSAPDSGAAFVFTRSGTTWIQQAYLKASQVSSSDKFGTSVAVSGDTVVVGAHLEDSATTGVNSTPNENSLESGAAYFFNVIANTAPLATAQAVSTVKDTAVAITLAATDAESNPLTYTVTSGPANGSLSGTAPNLTYTPTANYHGSDSFLFKVNDGTEDSATATVSITVNTAHQATAQAVTTAEDTPVAITLAGTNPSGTPLTYAVATGPAHGSLSGTAPNLTYTPAANYYGSDSFTFTASDGSADSAPATVSLSVTPVNDAPLATAKSVTTPEDTPLAITLTGTDVDGNPLTYAVITGPANGSLSGSAPNLTYTPAANYYGSDNFTFKVNDGTVNSATATVSLTVTPVNDAPQATARSVTTAEDTAVAVTLAGTDAEGSPLTYAVASGPAHGSLSGSAPNLTYIPAANYYGSDSFTFKVNDGTVDSAIATVTLTVTPVNDDAPLATAQSRTTAEDTAVAITLVGTDPDADPLTYAVVTGPTNGSLSGNAPNLTYTPALNYSGSDSFTFKVNDGTVDSATATVTLAVTSVNDVPLATAKSVTTVEDTAVAITLAGTDAEFSPLTYAVVAPPANGSLSGTAPNLTYTPAANYNGSDSFTFKVNDGTVDSATATVAITVTSVNDAPLATAKSVTTAEDIAVAITLAATDAEGSPLTYAVVTAPANGTLGGTAPNLTYTPALNYNGSDSFTFKVNDGSVDSATATVSLTVTPVNDAALVIAQQAYLKPSSISAGDFFGWSVAVSGETVVVGAISEDSSTTGVNSTPNESVSAAGAVYVFVRSGGAWTQQAYLKASQISVSDQFGYSVAISGDTVVVGAITEDSSTTGVNSTANESASDSGAAYVFVRSGTTWTQEAYLKASQVSASDNFGLSVAVSGETVVVGARGEDSSTTGVNSTANESAVDSGAAYVFVRGGTTWTQQAYLKASNTGAGDLFSQPVAISGNTVVVGAWKEDSSTAGVNTTANESAADAGATYVFVRSGTTWTQQAYLKASQVTANDQFGFSAAIAGDTLVVGAKFEDSSTAGVNSTANETATDSGAAYVFMRSGTTWTQQTYLKASQVTASDQFGHSVAVSGNTLVVGAYQEDSSTTGVNSTPNESAAQAGAAYVFIRMGTTWTQQGYLKAGQVTAADNFGYSVAISGETVIAGAYNEDSSTTGVNSTADELAANSGAAYAFTVIENNAPVATAQSVTTAEDTAVAITLAGTDADDDPLTYSVTTPPAHGSLSGTAPNLTYTPAADYYGSDSFTFTVSDGTVDTSTAKVSITVTPVNTAPLATAQSVTTAEDTALAITLAGTDGEGNPLTYAVATGPANGSLSGTAPNLTYTPAANYYGSDSFTFKVNDGTVDSATATVSITVTSVNDAPLAAAQSTTTAEDTAVAITLAGTDVENDALTYTVVAQPTQGSLSGSARNLIYTPAANYYGSDSFTFKVNDGTVDSATATVSITVTPVNDAPLAAAQSATTAEDTAVAITLGGTDAEGSSLTYAVVAQPGHGSLSGSARNLTYTPVANYHGSDSFTFTVNDGTVDSATATVSITVTPVNDAPLAAAQSTTTAEDTAVAITLAGTDVENDALTYTVVAQPTHGTLSGSASNRTYTPAANYYGSDSFTFKVNDGTVDSATATVSITVTEVKAIPVFTGYTASVKTGKTLAIAPAKILARASDPDGGAVTLTRVFGPSAQGGAVSLTGTVNYTPAASFTGTDSFDIELTGSQGGTLRATLVITVTGDSALGLNQTALNVHNGVVDLTFSGIPGRSYTIQRSSNLTTWTTLVTVTAAADGKIRFTDTSPPQPSGYYRTQN